MHPESGLCLFKHLRDLPTLYFIVYLFDCSLIDPLGGTAALCRPTAAAAAAVKLIFLFDFDLCMAK